MRAGGPAVQGATVRSLAAIAAELAVYGLAFGLLRNGINEWSIQTPSMLLGHCLRIVLPLLLLWWFQLRARGSQDLGGLRVAVLAVAVVLLAVVFLCGLGPSASSAIVLAARSLVSVLIYLRLFDVVHRRGYHPCAVYGVGRGVYEVSLVLGLLAYAGLKGAGLLGFMTPAVTYFFVSCILLVMLNGFAGALKLPFLHPEPVTDPASLPFDDACERLARERGLTERELQIMKLVVKGHTKKRIAEVLNLSEDTIRYHTKSLYRKLDVHSRQDLLDVLGIE